MKQPTLPPERLFELLAPSIVTLECLSYDNQLLQSGSGVVIAPASVVTNKHVVNKASIVKVRNRRDTWRAKVTHLHSKHDLAQLSVQGLDAPPIPLGMSWTVMIGESVFAIGSPLGLDLTLSDGLISGIRRDNGEELIQFSAPISSGSSGGGLFNGEGKLIGITTSYMRRGQNLNFAVPARLISTLGSHSTESIKVTLIGTSPVAASPSARIQARLEMKFPVTSFAVHADREQVIHVKWRGGPTVDAICEYLRPLILRRELPNTEFDFERDNS